MLPRIPSRKIIKELKEFEEDHPESGLVQFRSYISADQYLRLYRIVAEQIPQKAIVLDWGGGIGHFSYFLSASGHKTSLYCYSEDDLPNTQCLAKKGGFEVVQPKERDPIALPFAGETFDTVFSVGVLEHVRETGGNEVASLREIKRILKPGGKFICYHLPNRYSWIEALTLRIAPGKHHHQYRYTRKDIVSLCSQAGFQVRWVERYGILPRNQWGSAPAVIRNSLIAAFLYNIMDDFLRFLLFLFAQNYLFIAQKE